ncbi:hypothetical protein [Geodermatophilus sp. DSM 44513]|uniref:hypothetical protein n=1 Tax=Geodermatophilus sp. DSM 44513 TaxID=1528104 RepID=UPI0012714063|nr:hypothetical protein [Geodermatophilus sp. DSM 44513]WNV77648.1 hypothetical protein RTG05_10340 [Geodermatophilus sp. DSM 44513]
MAAGLRSLGAGRTVVVVAHRPETASRADRVLRVADGTVQELRHTAHHPLTDATSGRGIGHG